MFKLTIDHYRPHQLISYPNFAVARVRFDRSGGLLGLALNTAIYLWVELGASYRALYSLVSNQMSMLQLSQNQLSQDPAAKTSTAESLLTIELAPFQHPYLAATQDRLDLHRYPITLTQAIDSTALLGIFAAYCARLASESEFDIGLQIKSPDGSLQLFANQRPIRIQVQAGESFSQFQSRLKTSLDLTEQLNSHQDRLLPTDSMPVGILLLPSPAQLELVELTAAMTLVSYVDRSTPELIHRGAITATDSAAIVRQLQNFIPAAVAQPEQPLAKLPLISTSEQQQLLVDWNQTGIAYPHEVCIHHLFEQQVARTPESIAISFKSEQLTYQELNTRANQLAHYLILYGVEPDTLIGLQMERSIEMVVGLLAIHKAGGAYLPLDPDFPADRLALMIADSQAPLLLTQQGLVTKLVIGVDVQTIEIDTNWPEIAQQSTTNPQTQVKPNHLAYIIYTSGSTGKPKGVMVEHGNAVNFFTGMDERIGATPGVWLAVTSLSFDISVLEICWTLTRGFKVVIYNAKTERTELEQDYSIAGSIYRHQVTHLQCTPSMAGLLVADPKTCQAIGQIQTMMVGGEALTEILARQLQQHVGGQVHNMYGPTETTIWSTTHALKAVDGVVPLGRPIANTQLYILDKLQQPVPVGIPGELLIGGKGVTRGYLNRPDLTQERFIPNPFSDDPRERLYRTGDSVRYRADGNLEFLGRIDFQVKIRGYRIELGEIETVLGRHEAIREAVIIVREDVPGDKRLVAYFIAEAGAEPTSASLRAHLRAQLPEYMVPANFVQLLAFPLTPNRKVDRNAFPAPVIGQAPLQIDEHQTIEQALIEIWQQVLQIAEVKIADNFFELGGHSLIALELFAEIDRIWHKRLFLSVLFQAPTITALADVIRQDEISAPWSPLVLIESGGKKSPLFCIHPVGGNIFGYYDLAKVIDADRPIYGLQARGTDGQQQPFDRIEDMASYFIEAIRTIQPHGPYFLLGYSFGGIVAFEIARQLADRGEQTAFLGLLDIRNPTVKEVEIPLHEILSLQFKIVKKLPIEQKIKYILKKIFNRKEVRQVDRYRDEVMIELSGLKVFAPESIKVLDANLVAMKQYQPQVYAGAAHLFWSEFQDLYIGQHPDLGWGDVVTNGLEIEHILGNHATIMKEPNLQIIAEKLRLAIERGSRGRGD